MRRSHKIIIGVAGALLLIGVVAALILAWLLFGAPARGPKAVAAPDSLSSATHKLEACVAASRKDELVSLDLTVEEVNALLARSMAQPGMMESFNVDTQAGLDISAKLEDGLFHVSVSGKKGGDGLLGSGLCLFVTAAPEIKDGTLNINVQSVKLGNLPLPAGMLNKHGVFRAGDLKGQKGMVSLLDAVELFKVDKAGVTLKFHPGLLDKALGGSLPK